jgi:maltose O-acetyltransferase
MTTMSTQQGDPGPSLRLPKEAEPPLGYVEAKTNQESSDAMESDQPMSDWESGMAHRSGSPSGDYDTASARATDPSRSVTRKIRQLLREEFAGIHLRLIIARTLLALLPIHVGGRVRPMVFRLVGFQIGRGTVMAGTPTIIFDGDMYRKLAIGTGCWINIGCLFDLGAAITIGSNVSLGHGVLLVTNSHEIGPSRRRASALSAKPVNIGSGAWLGSRSMILPGVTIGAGAVVAAGSVVHQDVPPNTLVAGVPARPIRALLP